LRSSTIRGVEERRRRAGSSIFFFSDRRKAGMNKRKRVAIAKHRAKKKRTKARASNAR
jgi:hypothetical protein